MRRSSRGLPGIVWAALALIVSTTRASAQQPPAPEPNDHLPPAAASQSMPAMSDAEMDRVMGMHEDPLLAMVKLDQLERGSGDGVRSTGWEAEAWIGHDFDKLWLRSEGERESGRTDARIEALWDHAFASFWDWQVGVRRDIGTDLRPPRSSLDGFGASRGSSLRNWAAFGVQGIAPYWFEIEATAYLGESGRSALRLRVEYELLLTQRLILQPEFEANLYGRRDPARAVDSGINDATFGLRLRYEIRREIAPYLGVVWKHSSGTYALQAQAPANETQLVAGLRIWF